LFPFPNNPNGVYGRNTFTQLLPAGGQGKVLSGKADGNFRIGGRQQQLSARYNFTDDWRDIPVTGEAIFSTLRSRVRTQNFSTILNSELSGPDSARPIFNQLRASYGRTRLVFDERRDTEFLSQSNFARTLRNPEEGRFLLDAPVLFNSTLPGSSTAQYETAVRSIRCPNGQTFTLGTVEDFLSPFLVDPCGMRLGFPGFTGYAPVGQVIIGGFSPVGVDVFNFPQRRVNNTYQLADTVTTSLGDHRLAFGADTRRVELNSDLPRNARPLITFYGGPRLTIEQGLATGFSGFVSPTDLAAASAASGVFQTQTKGSDAAIGLRYYQLYFFGQDEWRVRDDLSISYGLRYEYTTPPRELNERIEGTFAEAVRFIPEFRNYIQGRTEIFEPDRNNFAPRIGIAYSPRIFDDRTTVLRAGYGIFYDQIIGAVVSQSRNVFPTFLTLNFAAGIPPNTIFDIFTQNTATLSCPPEGVPRVPATLPGTLNTVNPLTPLSCIVRANANQFPGSFQTTLPARQLEYPVAQHYSFTFEQQLNRSMVVSAAYIGTQGRHLLRATTPNLGPNNIPVAAFFDITRSGEPVLIGVVANPTLLRGADLISRFVTPDAFFNNPPTRPVTNVGAVTIYETSANSRYDALQVQVRGRYARGLQYQGQYTFSHAEDDVSDVFDVAGAPALPQNSLTRAGERADANFDVRHRFSYNLIYGFPDFNDRSSAFRFLFGGLELASTGQFQTGQPFTVNGLFDVNLDGNLTDRLNRTTGIIRTDDRQRPLILQSGTDPTTLLAALGQDGSVPRNSFRASNLLLFNVAAIKHFRFAESQDLTFRAEVFNLTNRENFGIPVRFLEAPGFGQATDTVTPGRRIQFALKYSF